MILTDVKKKSRDPMLNSFSSMFVFKNYHLFFILSMDTPSMTLFS